MKIFRIDENTNLAPILGLYRQDKNIKTLFFSERLQGLNAPKIDILNIDINVLFRSFPVSHHLTVVYCINNSLIRAFKALHMT